MDFTTFRAYVEQLAATEIEHVKARLPDRIKKEIETLILDKTRDATLTALGWNYGRYFDLRADSLIARAVVAQAERIAATVHDKIKDLGLTKAEQAQMTKGLHAQFVRLVEKRVQDYLVAAAEARARAIVDAVLARETAAPREDA